MTQISDIFLQRIARIIRIFVARGDDAGCRTIRMAGAAEAQKSV